MKHLVSLVSLLFLLLLGTAATAQSAKTCPHCPEGPPKVQPVSYLTSEKALPEGLLAYAESGQYGIRAGISDDKLWIMNTRTSTVYYVSSLHTDAHVTTTEISLQVAAESQDFIAFVVTRTGYLDGDDSHHISEDKLLVWNRKDTYLYLEQWITKTEDYWRDVPNPKPGQEAREYVKGEKKRWADWQLRPNGVVLRRLPQEPHCYCKYKFYAGKTIREFHEHTKKGWP